ncbi:hypothetical protein BCR44DRAFT_39007, partial [Catenaria anguillulae PL171]
MTVPKSRSTSKRTALATNASDPASSSQPPVIRAGSGTCQSHTLSALMGLPSWALDSARSDTVLDMRNTDRPLDMDFARDMMQALSTFSEADLNIFAENVTEALQETVLLSSPPSSPTLSPSMSALQCSTLPSDPRAGVEAAFCSVPTSAAEASPAAAATSESLPPSPSESSDSCPRPVHLVPNDSPVVTQIASPSRSTTPKSDLSFTSFSPSGFQDQSLIDLRSLHPQPHPHLGQVSLAICAGLSDPRSINVHVIVSGPDVATVGDSRLTVRVSLSVAYSTSDTPDTTDMQRTLGPTVTTFELPPPSKCAPCTSSGSVYTCTFAHPLLPHGHKSTIQVLIKSATVTLNRESILQPPVSPPPVLHLPKSTPVFVDLTASLNQAHLCDASIVPEGESSPIYVSRAILACASPYFRSIPWPSSASTPIRSPYPASIVVPCVAHMYIDCAPYCDKHAAVADLLRTYNVNTKAFDRHMWMGVMDLAGEWGLEKLVREANRAL